jgi:hypothetical protein
LGLDRCGLSPVVLRKVVYAGANSASFAHASSDLENLSDLHIDVKQVERHTERIGRERVEQRDAAVASFQARPLVEKDVAADPGKPSPPVAAVSIDGGRIQIRHEAGAAALNTSHWRESKAATLVTYASAVNDVDPDPDVPRCFLDLNGTLKLVRGMGHAAVGVDVSAIVAAESAAAAEPEPDRPSRPGRPEPLVRTVLASRATADEFGPMVEQAAWERNFMGSKRQVFLGDGQAVNWTVQREHFPTFTPVLDFVHALSYVFEAAFAGRPPDEGARTYRRWIDVVWSGKVASLLPELAQRVDALGGPTEEMTAHDPRRAVMDALRYLGNNAERMKYDEYRRRGLPIMTSSVESAIKQINRRVKGSEKFWTESAAEAVLQLRGDYLSETEPMEKFWEERDGRMDGRRPYRKVA